MKEVLTRLPEFDLRINHILVYFNCNKLPHELKVLALYDLFRMQVYSDANLRLKILQTVAQIKYNEYLLASLVATNTTSSSPSSPSNSLTANTTITITANTPPSSSINPQVFKSYEKWLSDYRDYRCVNNIEASNFKKF